MKTFLTFLLIAFSLSAAAQEGSVFGRKVDSQNEETAPLRTQRGARVEMRGYDDRLFATLDIDQPSATATLQTYSGHPHGVFSDTYASVTLRSASGELKFSSSWQGNKPYPDARETIALAAGDTFTITHREPGRGNTGRLQMIDKRTGRNLAVSTTVTYSVDAVTPARTTPVPVNGTSPALQTSPFVGKWKPSWIEGEVIVMDADGKFTWRRPPQPVLYLTWRPRDGVENQALLPNTYGQFNGQYSTINEAGDRITVSANVGRGYLTKIGDVPLVSKETLAQNGEAARPQATPAAGAVETGVLAREFDRLVAQQEATYQSNIASTNTRDRNLLEGLHKRAAATGNLELTQKIKEALEGVAKGQLFDADEPIRGKPQGAHEKELWKLKETRDQALAGAAKIAAQRYKADFEKLLRQAIQQDDLATAKKVEEHLRRQGRPRVSPFVGSWKTSWANEVLIIDSDGTFTWNWPAGEVKRLTWRPRDGAENQALLSRPDGKLDSQYSTINKKGDRIDTPWYSGYYLTRMK